MTTTTSYNLRIPNEVFTQLRQFQAIEIIRLNRTVSLHEIILKSIKDKTANKGAGEPLSLSGVTPIKVIGEPLR